MNSYVFRLQDIDRTMLTVVGGKGANLGELTKIEGIRVPDGFAISTEVFKGIIEETPAIQDLLNQLSVLKLTQKDKINEISSKLRKAIEAITIPKQVLEEVTHFILTLGVQTAYAIRSSATAEDLPTASFAGQQDTYLNVIGVESILKHISKCWASLFTERAVTYRIKNGFDHRKVLLSVVVQKMIDPQASGILFTADPVTSNRKVLSIDASFGLGEALVAGLVNADNYKVRNGKIIDKQISTKKIEILPLNNGGTWEQEIEKEKQSRQVLTKEEILQLENIGRKIELHFGCPQDIEWCLVDGRFYIVQSRPITTLYPIPVRNDEENHVYISVAHQQMMTDAMKPLGLSLFQSTAMAPMFNAGGRLFVDVTLMLASPEMREILLKNMGQHDPLILDALKTIIEREDIINVLPNEQKNQSHGKNSTIIPPIAFQAQIENDPSIVLDLIKNNEASIEELTQNIQTKSGVELFEFIEEDTKQLKKILMDPQSTAVYTTAINASAWLNEKMNEWLGEKNVADTLSQSVENNITSKMGLALMDVADVIRPYPKVIEYLKQVKEENFLEELVKFEGGEEIIDAFNTFLSKYGMRCAGEIDVTKARWSEKPAILIPILLNNIKNFEPNASKLKFEQGRVEAQNKEQELLKRLNQLADGEEKVKETKRVISILRNFIGYREYPKYCIVNRYYIYKLAMLNEAKKLVKANVIHEIEDIYYLTFKELNEAVRINKIDDSIINKRKEEFKLFEQLTPPRVITSDGEIVLGKYKRENLPEKAMVGLPVSSGVVEGRARVILKMEDALLEDDTILVTAFTDPSWTPLFVSVRGLVTEVGGLMTHGAVIAREYGLPAVVGVADATKIIKDGQRLRVNGTEGFVEIL